ncbi:MAG TPA: cytochrome c maturation protein CcmE [Allosphingosinicella sp.]
MKAKNQRLTLLLLAGGAVLVAVLLAMSALKDQVSYFYSAADVREKGLPLDRAVRVGGMVRALQRLPDGLTIEFRLDDGSGAEPIRVRYRGIAPELFREGSGAIAEGRFQPDRLFAATEILAKHDENYMPAELRAQNGPELHKTDTLK